jgi:hypothetical protein
MRLRANHVLYTLLLLGCGSGSTPVADLSQLEQVELCEQFRSDICRHSEFAAFCAKTCLQSCEDAASSGAITVECSDTTESPLPTDDAVADCGSSGDLVVCARRGGGCMFDALEATCR